MKVKVRSHKRKGKNKVTVVRKHARTKSQYGRGLHPNSKGTQFKPKQKATTPVKKSIGAKLADKFRKKSKSGISKHPSAKEAFKSGIADIRGHVERLHGAVQTARSKAGL